MTSWKHTCLRVPGHEDWPIILILEGVGGCIYCGDPGPEQQAKVDEESARMLTEETHDDRDRADTG